MPSISPIKGASPSIGPPNWPPKTAPSASACSGEAAASIRTPTFQPPSLIRAGASAMTQTFRPPTSLTSPFATWKVRATVHRSLSAGKVRPEVEHGQTMSQLQFSKYVPSSCHAILGLLSHERNPPNAVSVLRGMDGVNKENLDYE